MHKKIILLSLFLFLVITSFIVRSQESTDNTIVQSGYSTKCLEASTSDAEWYDGWCNGCPHNINDPSTFDDTICVIDTGQATGSNEPIHQCPLSYPPSNGIAHFTLTNAPENRFAPGTQIIPIIPSGSGYTTTNRTLDESLGLPIVNSSIRLEYPDNPSGIFYADQNGNVTIRGIMTGALQGHTNYPFYALYPPTVLGTGGQGTEQITGNLTSQQQGTIDFSQTNFEDTNTKQTCTAIWWDPYGRVFDSQSLEPMTDIQVRILKEIKPTEKLADILTDNPVTTKQDGIFNFLTSPSTYYLRLNNIPETHTFSASPKLNPKYNQIYRQSANSQKSIYIPDEPIKEIIDTPDESARNRPSPEERDIALDPGKNKPFTSLIIHMELTEIVDGEDILFRGRASHPYPVITIKDQKGNILLSEKEFLEDQARYGFWSLRIKRTELPQDTSLIPILSKNSKFFSSENDINIIDMNYPRFEPILATIEGYAKDNYGKVLPNAKVQIKLYNSDKVFSETTADSTGFFKISSRNLPPFSYYLVFNGETKTTSQFVNDNSSYLKSRNLNLMSRDNLSNIEEKTVNFSNMANYSPNETASKIKQTNRSQANNFLKKQIIIIVILILFLTTSLLMLLFYIKKNKA